MLFPLIALQASATAPQPAPTPPTKLEKKICRASVATGSILAGRLCMTPEKWREADQRDQSNVDAVRHSLSTKGTDRSF